ncbi:MAG: hypothetical protein HY909_15240 [Deltaproteobacteria bacterium]|nr:hypothetical protein [Deltaproteobacteria bacterium]
MKTSLETRERRALVALTYDREAEHLRARGQEPPPAPEARVTSAVLLQAHAVSPSLAVLLGEAHLLASTRAARRRYRRLPPLMLAGGRELVPWGGYLATVVTEPSAARRAALVEASGTAARDHRAVALAVVDALREAREALPPAVLEGLRLGVDEAAAVLKATDEALRELDPWVCRGLELDPSRLPWGDRLRSLLAPSLPRAIPPATWREVSTRWIEACGLGHALRRVSGDLRPAAKDGEGVHCEGVSPGERAVLVGRPWATGGGLLALAGASLEAVVYVTGRGERPSEALGVDRALFGAASALGRRLLLERAFLLRVAGVERPSLERALLEGLHLELLTVRAEAVASRFLGRVLSRSPEPGSELHEDLGRALGATPPGAWGAHLAAWALEPGCAWGARTVGSRVEPALRGMLRETHDEDWFRNPRAGASLALSLEALRAQGAERWAEAVGRPSGPEVLSARFAEVLREARR